MRVLNRAMFRRRNLPRYRWVTDDVVWVDGVGNVYRSESDEALREVGVTRYIFHPILMKVERKEWE